MDAKLNVMSRDLKGSENARRMRRDGKIPGVIYSEGKEAREICLDKHDFEKMLHHHAGDQMMVKIELDGKDSSVLLKDVQHDMMGNGVLHVDFMEVSLTQKLKITAQLELVGEPVGVVTQGGVLEQMLHSLDIACLPGDIPEKIEVDVSALNLGDSLSVKDIQLDASKFDVFMDGDVGIASVLAPRVAVADSEEEEEGEGEGGEPEVINEKKEEE